MIFTLYQVNTRVWLGELRRQFKQPFTLADVPEQVLDRWSQLGIDWIWLLSVWQTGDAGRLVSRTHPHWLEEYRQTLPDLQLDDIQGSGFAITDYVVSPELGGPAALARFRQRLALRGIRLMLDFVPNHVALDHRWVAEGRDLFIEATETQLASTPQNFVRLNTPGGSKILAYGRDPYFDGWPDTLQLDYSRPETIDAMRQTLVDVAQQCDGVRCDMAMLILPEVFSKTWGRSAQPFWYETIQRVRQEVDPTFCFLAEVYWDMEWQLQQLGFDYTYDKRLYDRLLSAVGEPAVSTIRQHLQADLGYQQRMARFLENHDEQRAARQFETERHRAAAMITYLTPALRFFHEGQWEGRRVKVSPHLVRKPDEPSDQPLAMFYAQLLALLKQPLFKTGTWRLLDCSPAWTGNPTHQNFVVFSWENEQNQRVIVAVNYSPNTAQCHVHLPWPDIDSQAWELADRLSDRRHQWQGKDLVARGLYLNESAWSSVVFELHRQ